MSSSKYLPPFHFTDWSWKKRVLSLCQIIRETDIYRSRGVRVVLANGIFDILHAGHVRYLRGSRHTRNEILVVAVNGDLGARRLKGPGRPILSERDRAALVAALGCVDFVTIFNSSNVRGILKKLRPDFHSKGTDYTPKTVPEGNLSRELGIRIRISGDPKRHSTTRLLRNISRGK